MDYVNLYSDFKGIFPQYADRMDMLAKDANELSKKAKKLINFTYFFFVLYSFLLRNML